MKTKEQLKELIEEVLTRKGYGIVRLAYLFGSRAKGIRNSSSKEEPVGPLSDYDFGILTPHESGTTECFTSPQKFELQSELSRRLDADVDVVLLNQAPIELQYNVISFGILLFERELNERVEYESRVLSRYGDYLPVLRRQKKELIKGGSNEARVQRYREALGETERLFEQTRSASG